MNSFYLEKDNRGTRQDSESHANAYWMSRMLSPKKDPFIMYTFVTEKDAREALLELPCIHVAEDSKKLICTEILTFGCYSTTSGICEAIITGDDLSYELWEQAKESFIKHGGKPRGQGELKPEKRDVFVKKESTAQKEKALFVREDRRRDKTGKTTIYRIYKAPDAASAKVFLEQNPVNQNFYYFIVETPEGNYCRDRLGLYKE